MSDDEHWEGRGASIQAACEDAWHKARDAGRSGRFKVETTAFEASNPIHVYIVIITPSG
jgi:hypothetical protein